MKEIELKLRTWVLRFIHPEGNGYALVNARSLQQAQSVFLQQTKFKEAKVVEFFEQRFSGQEMQIVCEGSIETVGKSAYDLAVLNGFEGTVTEFLESLKGEKGDPFTYEDMTEKQKEDLASHVAEGKFIQQGSLGTINGQSIEDNHDITISSSDGVFVVTVTKNGSTYSADKTVAEINEAINNGRVAIALYDSSFHTCILCDNLGAVFTLVYGSTQTTIVIDRLNGVQVTEEELQEKLISGSSIKTINNTSLLGSGDMAVAPRPFIVEITQSNDAYMADKTFAEIFVAYNGGAAVYFSFDNVTSQAYLSLGAIFIAIFHYINVLAEVMLSEDGVAVTTYTLLTEGSLKTINNQSLEGSGNLSLATQEALSNFCPIIEENSPSRVVNMTADAPFATLTEGQRIIFKAKWMSARNCTLNLTLSDGNITGNIGIMKRVAGYLDGAEIDAGDFRPDGLYELIYSGNTWWLLGFGDTNTTYTAMTQAEVDAGTGTAPRSITPKLLCDNFDKVTTLVEVTATGDVTQALDSGKFYRFGEVDSLALTFNLPQAGMGSYGGKFTASASWTALALPDIIDEAAGNDTISAGKRYEFQLFDNVIVIKEI